MDGILSFAIFGALLVGFAGIMALIIYYQDRKEKKKGNIGSRFMKLLQRCFLCSIERSL